MYSLAFLVDDHTKTLNKFCGGLEPKLLLSHIEKTDDPLCVSRLNENEQIELCKLMVKFCCSLDTAIQSILKVNF
jgi:hypothetical protein